MRRCTITVANMTHAINAFGFRWTVPALVSCYLGIRPLLCATTSLAPKCYAPGTSRKGWRRCRAMNPQTWETRARTQRRGIWQARQATPRAQCPIYVAPLPAHATRRALTTVCYLPNRITPFARARRCKTDKIMVMVASTQAISGNK